jgi:site-specific recombinase XerD
MIDLKTAHFDFVADLRSKNRAYATILAYGKDIEQLVDFLRKKGKKTVEEIETSDLETFMDQLFKAGYTAKSVSRKTNATKTFFRFLKAQKGAKDDPAVSLAHPKFEVKPPRILSPMEYRALRDACRGDPRTSAIVEILLQTGVRISELAGLETSDVKFGEDEKPGELIIKARERHPKRSIPLNLAAQKAIQRYLKIRPKSRNQALFVTKTGRPLLIRNIRTVIDRYYKVAGIKDAKVNDLRHTFIARQLAAGVPLTTVSKLAGHKRLSTTEKYLSYIQKREETGIKLEEL